MTKLIYAFIIISFVMFPFLAHAEPEKIQISLGESFKKESFPYKFVGVIEDKKSDINVYVFDFNKAIDNKVFVGVTKKSNVIMFYFFHPRPMNKKYIEKNFGKQYQKVNNTIIYTDKNIFFEFDNLDMVSVVGRFVDVKDL